MHQAGNNWESNSFALLWSGYRFRIVLFSVVSLQYPNKLRCNFFFCLGCFLPFSILSFHFWSHFHGLVPDMFVPEKVNFAWLFCLHYFYSFVPSHFSFFMKLYVITQIFFLPIWFHTCPSALNIVSLKLLNDQNHWNFCCICFFCYTSFHHFHHSCKMQLTFQPFTYFSCNCFKLSRPSFYSFCNSHASDFCYWHWLWNFVKNAVWSENNIVMWKGNLLIPVKACHLFNLECCCVLLKRIVLFLILRSLCSLLSPKSQWLQLQ